MFNFKKLFRRPYEPIIEEEPTENIPPRFLLQLPLQNMFYGLGLIILLFWILKTFKFIFIAITLSMFSCFMLLPIIDFIVQKTNFNRILISATISFIYAIALVFFSWIILNNLLRFFSDLNTYENQLNNIINDVILRFNNTLNSFNQDILPNKITQPRFNIRDYIFSSMSVTFYLNSANNFFTFLSGALLVFIFVFFILSEAEDTSLKLKSILKQEMYESITVNINIISKKISKYLQLKVIVSFLTSLLVWLLLNFYQVQNPLTWAFFTFAFNFIPNIGSIAITILITLISIIQFYPTWNIPLIVGLLITGIQILIGNILDPKLQGDKLDLSPLLILISLAFWGYLWGVVGMFLAVPMLEILRITANHIKGLKSIAVFISSGKSIRVDHKAKQIAEEPKPE